MKILLMIVLTLSWAFAAPALNKLRTFKQADGSTFQARAFGNQYLNWIETPDGEVLLYNETSKNFEYAKIQNNTLKASGVKYNKENSIRARSLARTNKVDKELLYKLWSQKQEDFYKQKGLGFHKH